MVQDESNDEMEERKQSRKISPLLSKQESLRKRPRKENVENVSNGLLTSHIDSQEVDTFNARIDEKVHETQDSLFSSSSGWTNYRGFLNLAILLLIVSNGRVALENLIKYGILINPLQWLSYFLTDPFHWPNVLLYAATNVFVLAAFYMEKMLAMGRLSNRFAAVFYPLLFLLHLGVPAGATLYLRGNPIFAGIMLSVYVAVCLKLWSYAHVNYWCRKAVEMDSGKSGEQTKWSKHHKEYAYPKNLTLSNLYYFMYAPTLCYELRFPKSPAIRKTFVLKRIVELISLSFVIVSLCQQWVVPLLSNSMQPFTDMDMGRCIERVLKLAIPNHLIWLLFFYTVFHSAFNLTAELLRFADRQFYRDFWNAETVPYFWKTWNIPVHRWAVRHIYKPMVRHKWSKLQASTAVFLLSAFLHEYLVSIPLNLFRCWAFQGMLMQIPLSLLTQRLLRGGRAGNMVVWMSLILGQPMAILMYVHDYYVLNYTADGV